MGSDNQTKLAVVMVPFIAHGHLNQLLHLANLVSSYNIPVHFICATANLRQGKSRLHGVANSNNMIHFHEIEMPPFESPPPDPTNHFPTHLQSSLEATLQLRNPVFDYIHSVSQTATRVAVIHDIFMSYVVQDVHSMIHNAECYNFRPLSVFYTFWDLWEKAGRPFEVNKELLNKVPSQNGIVSHEFRLFAMLQLPHMNNDVGNLFNSSRVIEGEFIEYLERKEISGEKKTWAVGPVSSVHTLSSSDVTLLEKRHKCLEWLDKQPVNSVIYVSFGTTTTFSDDQIRELATGLERSEQRFIWVVRVADVGDTVGLKDRRVELPDGFEERAKEKGLIEWGWAPQLEILGHSATGGFMSHCGWNSSLESISMGVPMATWPMHSDQPRNAVFITEVLKIGVAVKDWERKNELVTSVAVEKAVRALMGSREGDEMRKKAAKFGNDIKLSMIEGGVSRLEMDSFISYLRR